MVKMFLEIFLLFLLNQNGVTSEFSSFYPDFSPHTQPVKRSIDQPYKMYQKCKTPAGADGHCMHARYCPLPELQQNSRLLDYMCVIEQTSVGVCCPDDQSSVSSSFLFPRQGDDPIWDTNEISNGNTPTESRIRIRPEERGCGLSTKSISKIVGGRQADPKEWPWMAALLRRGVKNAFCGGVLITDRHVLTAAHCISQFTRNDITVRLGEYNFGAKNETRSRDFRVADIRQHIDFDDVTYDNDIAILKLQTTTMFNTYIWPVCMPPRDDLFEGYTGFVIGWGSQMFGGPDSDVLMEVSVPVWSKNDCQSSYIERISDAVVCAGDKNGGRDSCQGDSGGPLLVRLANKRWVTVGIVSWGVRCGEKNRPGIYTRVTSFTDWIIENAVF